MMTSFKRLASTVFIFFGFAILLCLPENGFSAIATLQTKPASGVAPLEVQIYCIVAGNTSQPKSYTMDFGDGSPIVTVESGAYAQLFTHTYSSGLYKPICNVAKTIGTDSSTDPGNIIVAKWKFKTRGEIDSSPAIGPDGTVYIGSDDGALYAVDPETGVEIWKFQTGDPVKTCPAIGPDGTIYFGSTDNYLYAVRPNGELKWSYNIGEFIYSSAAIGTDGRTIYVGSTDNYLYAISAGGDLKWKFKTGDKIISSPAIGFDGLEEVVYFGSLDGNFYALAADNGALKWTFSGNAEFYASPAIDQDGQIYVGECRTGDAEEYNFKFYSINLDGTKRWEFDGGTGFYSSPAIGPDGLIYVGSWDGSLYAFTRTGAKSWSVTTSPPRDINASPAVSADGVVYAGCKDGNFYAFESPAVEEVNRQDWVFQTTEPIIESSPAIDGEGTIYFASRDKCLYAVNPGGVQAADASWPMFRKTASRTGNSEEISIPAIISAVPERNSVDVDIHLKTVTINFSPEITDSQVDVDSFRMMKINDNDEEEEITGYGFLDFVRYNNSGYHIAAVFTRLDDDIPLEYNTEYKVSISYFPTPENETDSSEAATESTEETETETSTFSVAFMTEAEPVKDPDPHPKGDFSCFINTLR